MMDFTESLSIVLPEVGESYKRFQESTTNSGLIIEIAAIHEGLTANFNNYSAKELEASIESWVQPYPRPIIINHDSSEDPLGRVMAAKMGKEDGLSCIMLQTAISKPEAIERYMDNRYLTGSVGGKVEHALCSICSADWATASMFSGMPCEHERGKLYKGKLATLDMKGINWKEYSMVNTPADAHSGVRDIKPSDDANDTESGEGWVKAHIFSVDMNKESVVEFTESGTKDLLAGTKRKIAVPTYHNMRGSFLSVLAISEDENNEENDTVSENTNEEKEDILGIAESLSDDLADNQGDGTEAPEDVVDEPVVDGSEDAEDEEVPEPDAQTTTDVADEDSTPDEGVDSNADDQPVDDEIPTPAVGTEEPAADDAEDNADEDSEEKDEIPAEAGAELAIAQERIAALEAEITELSEENTKLRSVLKKGLAERVVDRKIDLGYEDVDTRSTLIEEHINRSAGSLADSLRDLMKVRPAPMTEAVDGINFTPASGSKIVKGDKRVTTIPFAEESKDEPIDPSEKFVDVLAEGLMGRRAL